jgi:hypothetical protein
MIGMLLVRVTWLIDPASELHSTALLHNVRCLVCSGVKVWRAVERDRAANRERARAERVRGLADGGSLMRRHARDVVAPEALLDLVAVGKLTSAACDCVARDVVRCAGAAERPLDERLFSNAWWGCFATALARQAGVLRSPLNGRDTERRLDEAVLPDGRMLVLRSARLVT